MNRRTTFVTAAAITGTVLAGTTAVAANIGILNSAESGPVGDLNATAQIASATTVPEPQIVDVYLDDPAPMTTFPPGTLPPGTIAELASETAQEFSVADAGTVTVVQTETGIRLGEVAASAGWAWESSQSSATEFVVTFTSADRTYIFYASVGEDGTIVARVDEPIVKTVTVPAASSGGSSAPSAGSPPPAAAPTAAAPPAAGGYDDDDDDYEDDEHEDEEHDDDHDDEEHEGGDDDD